MSKVFKVKLTSPPGEMLEKARAASHKVGIKFEGDEQTGHFNGHGVEGRYQVVEDTLSVSVTKKPFVMPWTLIETTFKGFFV
jgi:hypothetical protein